MSGSAPAVAEIGSPPVGGTVELLIHLAQYYDWTPIPPRTPSSGVSGLPSSSSSDSGGQPTYKKFEWFRGIPDDRAPPPFGPRLQDTCRRPLAGVRRDDRPNDDDHRDAKRRDWRNNTNARRRHADNLPRPQNQASGDHRRRHYDVNGGRRVQAKDDDQVPASRGRSDSRSLVRRRARDPQQCDDEGWERRRSRSPPRQHRPASPVRNNDDSLGSGPKVNLEASTHENPRQHALSILAPRDLGPAYGAPPPPPCHPDPLMEFFVGLCQEELPLDSFSSGQVHDPMLHEFTSAASTRALQSLPFSSPRSPQYAPVSKDWAPAASIGVLPSSTGSRDGPELGAHVEEPASMCVQDMDIGSTGPMQLHSPELPVAELGLGEDLAQDEHSPDNNNGLDSESFLNDMFTAPPPAAVPAPAPRCPRQTPRARSSSAEPSRRSVRQSKKKFVIPVAQRATHRLIRQLDLAGVDEPIGDEAIHKYIAMYKYPLPRKAMDAIRAVMRLANGDITKATAALAAEELTAQATAA